MNREAMNDKTQPDVVPDLTRTELRRIAEEFKSERDAAKRDAMQAFDQRNVLLDQLAELRTTLLAAESARDSAVRDAAELKADMESMYASLNGEANARIAAEAERDSAVRERDALRVRLEIGERPDTPDGIACRDATICGLDEERDALAAKLAEARALMKRMEWAGTNDEGQDYCVSCGAVTSTDAGGHWADCPLAAFLHDPKEGGK